MIVNNFNNNFCTFNFQSLLRYIIDSRFHMFLLRCEIFSSFRKTVGIRALAKTLEKRKFYKRIPAGGEILRFDSDCSL